MTRKRTKSRAAGHESSQSKSDSPVDSLDAAVDEVMERLVRVLVRAGAKQRSIQRAFRRAWLRVPPSAIEEGRRASCELIDASHVLTLWFSDPLYVDARGDPLPLPLRGPTPSLASLVQHVDPTLDPKQVLKVLIQADAVRASRGRYAPRSRAVALRGTGAPLHASNLRALRRMLRTQEHNLGPKDKVPAWFEYVAENPRFPASARERFDAGLREDAMAFLRNQDSRMLIHERKAKPGEPTVRMGVGVYRFEEEVLPGPRATTRVTRSGLQRNRKKAKRRDR